ncbi:GTPase Era [Marinihelvus fidelis]|uniref:GTPase Era n=1 Tax=Marinihelvus fidelis TaxID=2613842 RepID=A0A5N0TE06_9GAMM|nr:GTPase Era [Marinihelvus fidelis]KAA9133272.1 GTPase Era [Marinihelvus fidelis]
MDPIDFQLPPEGGEDSDYRFGYVALIGRPNVGKSTLLNQILGQKVSIVTHKPQTTRQRVAGIKTTAQGQVVYLDTPGIHQSGGRALNQYMNRVALATFRDVEAVLFLLEAGRLTRQDRKIAKMLSALDIPVFLVINKVDEVEHKQELLAYVTEASAEGDWDEVFLISALKGDGVADVEKRLMDLLPFSMPFYDEDQITDRSERFLAAELLREALTLRLHQELPYALNVEIEHFKREGGMVRIGAIIWVERDSQKQIVIGKGGQVLKQVGQQARKAMEEFLDEKVFLQTWVKVAKDWSRSERAMERMGFDE